MAHPRVIAQSGVAVLLLGAAVVSFFLVYALLPEAGKPLPTDPRACPDGEKIVLTKPFPIQDGHAYRAALPSLANLSDSNEKLFHSPVLLCENNKLLGPPHTFHAEIAKKGLGGFSHYQDHVVFSSSDNSDPNSNGRQYTIVVPSSRR
jgi:hypothetical protein